MVAGPVGGGRRGKQRGIRHAVTGRRPREGRPGPGGGGGGGGGEDQRRGGPAVQPPTTPALFIIGGGEPGPVAGERTTKQEAFSGSSQSECAQEQARHRICLWLSWFFVDDNTQTIGPAVTPLSFRGEQQWSKVRIRSWANRYEDDTNTWR